MLLSIPEQLLEQLRTAVLIGDTKQLNLLFKQVEQYAPWLQESLLNMLEVLNLIFYPDFLRMRPSDG